MKIVCELKDILKHDEIKVSELAYKTSISSSLIYRYCNNKAFPTLFNAYTIANALNKTIEDIWKVKPYGY